MKEHVISLISNYEPKKTCTTNLQMSIILTDEIPVTSTVRRLAPIEKQQVKEQIQEWLEQGIIEKSNSDFASAVVLVKRKNHKPRLCIDFRALNAKTIKDRFPLPNIEDIFDQLHSGKIFTTLDLKNAYFHIDLTPESYKYTAFISHEGLFHFKKCCFGLSNAPSMFQRYIQTIFQEQINEGTVIIYLDDIIIPSETVSEGIKKLESVLNTASKFGLQLNLKKCQFLKEKINFLGQVIENGQIKPSLEKTAAVQNFPQPRNSKQIQSFLGLTGYFRKYIKNYALIARPLSDLLRKDIKFEFGPLQKEAFETLKKSLSTDPVLHLYKPGSKLELHTDASKLGFGAILFQIDDDDKLHPISYMSKKTSPQEEKLSSYELEVLAVIKALTKFRTYVLGTKIKIVTDCSAFKQTINKKDLIPKIARWVLFLEDFEYEIVHRSGSQMRHVDSLSRYPTVMVALCDDLTARVQVAQMTDDYIKSLKELSTNNKQTDFVVQNNILYKCQDDRRLLVIPDIMKTEIIRHAHAQGHFAAEKTKNIIERDYFFPNMQKNVEHFIQNCVECILVNRKRGKGEGFLHPIPKEDFPLGTYHIDFIGPLASTNKQYNHILTVIDAFSKFVWLYPVKGVTANDAISKLQLQQTVFGNPIRCVTDKGSAFTSKEFTDYCADQSIDHIQITTGIPRGNGQVERVHATLIPLLSKLSIDNPTKWYTHVPDVQRVFNSTAPRSTKRTPFELMIGVQMRQKADQRILEILQEENELSYINIRENYRNEARENIMRLQEENRRTYNKHRKKATEYKKGDLVAIQRTQFGSGLKLRPKFYGPYRITKEKPNERYLVEKVGIHEGPNNTSSAADHMKPWSTTI